MDDFDFYREEIHGFASPGEYDRFLRYLEGLTAAGVLQEIPADPDYGPGLVYGGRWFRHGRSAEIWRLVPPDFPFKGLWEPVHRSGQ